MFTLNNYIKWLSKNVSSAQKMFQFYHFLVRFSEKKSCVKKAFNIFDRMFILYNYNSMVLFKLLVLKKMLQFDHFLVRFSKKNAV